MRGHVAAVKLHHQQGTDGQNNPNHHCQRKRFSKDESIVLPYCASGRAPNRIYLVRLRVNEARDDIEFLPLGKR